MHRRPIIGIPTQTQEPKGDETPRVWIMGHSYVHSLISHGAIPWLIPLLPHDLPTLRAIYEQLDGLFLAGGVDMDPANYGEARTELCGRVDPDRDAVELQLARWALADHKPILGVCRGVQVLTVAGGGALYQDVQAQHPSAIRHDYYPYTGNYSRDMRIHDVMVAQDTRLNHILQDSRVVVNSMHHQGIKRMAAGFIPTSYAPDGLIESIEAPNGHFAVGVQWHPEEFVGKDTGTDRLFCAFMHEAGSLSRPTTFPAFSCAFEV